MGANIFGRVNSDNEQILDWTAEKPSSRLAFVLLELVRVCLKDIRAPDYKEEAYSQIELSVSILFENLAMPSLVHYQQEILAICNQMIIVKKAITPIMSDILYELINQAEVTGKLINVRCFTMFMSHGSNYLLQH